MRLQPKKWEDFQHYKDREPIWIKLHRKLLNDYKYHCLPVASKAIAPLLWLLASEYEDGVIDATEEEIAFRLRISTGELVKAIEPLISSGFFVMYQDDSNTLAKSNQDACLEKRREETEKRQRESKSRYGEFSNVLLTDEEYEKLKTRFNGSCQERIEKLSTYLESSGKRYKSHYATILSWSQKDDQKKKFVSPDFELEDA